MENPMKLHIKNVHETKEKDQKLDIERNFKCPECHSKFVAKNSATAENIMKLHLEICSPKQKLRSKPKTTDFKTKDKAKNFQCEICSQIYSINTDLIEHKLDIHENKMLRKCPYCYLEYRGKTSMNMHIETVHKGEKSYQYDNEIKCSYCDIYFRPTKMKSLKRHINKGHKDKLPNSEDIKMEKPQITRSYKENKGKLLNSGVQGYEHFELKSENCG